MLMNILKKLLEASLNLRCLKSEFESLLALVHYVIFHVRLSQYRKHKHWKYNFADRYNAMHHFLDFFVCVVVNSCQCSYIALK